MKIAVENAQLRDEAPPPTQQQIDAIADVVVILEQSDLFDTIVEEDQGVYIALCSQHTKNDEPFLCAARSALTKISSSKPPSLRELKITWSVVSLRDFSYNISAMQLEKALHQKLQHRLRGQKLWIGTGKGGGYPTSNNVSMCYGATAR